MKLLGIISVITLLLIISCTQGNKTNVARSTNDATIIGKLQYPYDFQYEGNPLSRMHGAADPSAHVWDGVVWVFTSQDRNMDSTKHRHHYAAMDGYHAFSSTDMINWTNHGEIFHSLDLNDSLWGPTPENYMWAPGAARKQDKNGVWTYYLYYPHNVRFDGERWVTGVATAPTPAGPYTDQGPLKGGRMGMDPMVFVDDDGEAYIYSNSTIVAKLKPDMITLAEEPRKIEYAPESVLNDRTLRFSEGSYMHKKNGAYYYSYSNFHNKEHQGFYAMGDSPYGPFEWKGPMAPKPQGAQDHHSIIEFNDQWYYFYHIAIGEFPKYKESQGRIACYDKLFYNEDGTIQMVIHTR
jgi:arabinoxylan arabinofuranohydrolase